ncbi:MAG: hypothetical protein G5Z42_03590 [Caldisphaeraceae archaeon]|nr:hypothetical protein [Caldisphaeraceae archaeon]MEB3797891.1 hypothetical protein [Caldisphaeraceae archaeon]
MKRNKSCNVKITIRHQDSVHIARSLAPDNISEPNFLRIRCWHFGEKLFCNICVENLENPKRILSIKNTLNDILINLKAVLDSIT